MSAAQNLTVDLRSDDEVRGSLLFMPLAYRTIRSVGLLVLMDGMG